MVTLTPASALAPGQVIRIKKIDYAITEVRYSPEGHVVLRLETVSIGEKFEILYRWYLPKKRVQVITHPRDGVPEDLFV